MDDKLIITQILDDMRRHSSAESVMRSQLSAKVAELEKEVNSWEHESLKDDQRIRTMKYTIALFASVLKQIANPPNAAGEYALTRADCENLARAVLEQEASHEEK
jgi:hypothetical protein